MVFGFRLKLQLGGIGGGGIFTTSTYVLRSITLSYTDQRLQDYYERYVYA